MNATMKRLVITDEELLVVFTVLLYKLKKGIKEGKFFMFPPWKFDLPEGKIEGNGKGGVNFSFESEVAEADLFEALRLLGVTLYHLAMGKSEHTHESYILDGYYRPINSSFWPTILILLKKEAESVEQVEESIKAVNPDEMKTNIQPQSAPNAAASKTKTANDIISELANEPIKIVSHEQVANFWGLPVPQDVQIRYNEATLREAIEANNNGEQWYLAYYSGLSLRQMKDKIGTDRDSQSCFDKDYTWWLNSSEDSWATKNLVPGYYLLNFNGKFASKKWADQNQLVTALGSVYERANETVVSEVVISNFNVHNRERLLNNWYHWGQEATSDGYRLYVGYFDSHGFFVYYYGPSDSHSYLHVVVARKFDF